MSTIDLSNPLVQIRRGRRLDPLSWALDLGLPLDEVHRHEFGMLAEISNSMRVALYRLGMDGAFLAEEYRQWRQRTGMPVLFPASCTGRRKVSS